jgi:hypothetical protein
MSDEMTAEQFIAFMEGRANAAKANKFGAKRTPYGDRTYDSGAEARYAARLDMLKLAGDIREWTPQPVYVLGDDIKYRADFRVTGSDGRQWVVDVKGCERGTRFPMIRRLWKKYGPLPLHVVTKDGTEIIEAATKEPTP